MPESVTAVRVEQILPLQWSLGVSVTVYSDIRSAQRHIFLDLQALEQVGQMVEVEFT